MTELFANVPQKVKDRAAAMFDIAMSQKDLVHSVATLKEYLDTCYNEEEHQYVQFYFHMRLEQLLNNE